MVFETNYKSILQKINRINPLQYGKTRNYVDGAVTYLSPYISRGVISTKQVFQHLLKNEFGLNNSEKLIQELAWRDYWQQVWIAKGDAINNDFKSKQEKVRSFEIPHAILFGKTGIEAIDVAINNFYKTGYIHNHVRMYIASISCNIAKCHWKQPAQWMYYHLLDADWASNALSWQWVAGTNSKKKYYANQENINTFCHTHQHNTFLDVAYYDIDNLEIPEILSKTETFIFKKPFSTIEKPVIDKTLPTLIYNFYNIDPKWHSEKMANRILLLEPSVFEKYPVSKKSIDFAIALSKNIPGIQIYTNNFNTLLKHYRLNDIIYKEHPLNEHYNGTEEPRDWMFNVNGYFPSFFAYWKKCKKQLKYNRV